MDGLIKGLINVALDVIDGDGEEQQRRNQATSQEEEDERSRATWAEVSFNLLQILDLDKEKVIFFVFSFSRCDAPLKLISIQWISSQVFTVVSSSVSMSDSLPVSLS